MSITGEIIKDKGWTLFLDRDGVVNVRLVDEYVRRWDEFAFIDGVLEAIPVFNRFFAHVVVVTNQQGIGKGLMSEYDLGLIHGRMLSSVESAGGRIDGIFHCPHLKGDGCSCRKPLPGMAEAAMRQFGDIHMSRSVMAGDSSSDMGFAENAGMRAVFIGTDVPEKVKCESVYPSLYEFSRELTLCGIK